MALSLSSAIRQCSQLLPYDTPDLELIADDLRAVFGAEAKVEVVSVHDIEPLPSGKRAVAVNLMNRTRRTDG